MTRQDSKAMFESAPLGYQSLDQNGFFIDINQAWIDTLGYSKEEIIGKWFGDFLASDYVEAFRERFPIFLSQGKIHSEFYMIHKNGDKRYIVFDGRLGLNPDGSFRQTHCILKDETARKLHEEALKQSEFFLKKAQQIGKIGHFSYDLESKTLVGSNELYHILDIDETVPLLEAFSQSVHPEDYATLFPLMEKAIAKGVAFETEHRVCHKNGTILQVQSKGELTATPGGLRMVGTVQDITDRKDIEEKLQRSRESYRALIEGLPDITMRYDCQCRPTFVSSNISEYLDFTPEAFINKDHKEYGFSDDLCQLIEYSITSVYETGKPCEIEFSFNGKRGYTTLNTRFLPEFDAAGNVNSTFSINRDITQHKLTEDRFQAFFSQITQLAYIVSPDANIIDVNQAALDTLGYEKSELIGKPIGIIFSADSKVKTDYLRQQWQQTGTIKNEEIAICTKSGEIRTVLLNVSSIRNEHGVIIHSVCLQTDITEQKRMQEELIRSQKLESLGILAGGIAHDFNNLLGGIFGYIEMAAADIQNGNSSDYLEKALKTIERAKGLTQQFLTFSKGGSPAKTLTSLSPFIKNTVNFALSGSKLKCHFEIPENLWLAEFDVSQIAQVVENIVINAKQATPDTGMITLNAQNVSLCAHPQLSSGNYVKISIIDRGTGIAPDILPNIFDPFFTTKEKGRGLGLSTSYSIVKKHGGCIEVESTPGRGSSFHVFLPATPNAKLESATKGKHLPGKGTILVMDDEEILREILGQILKNMGFATVITKDGAEALEAFLSDRQQDCKIRGMIFDLTIPGGKGGKETIEEIREIDKEVPVIVSSGYADDPVMADPIAYGFNASICKPYRKADLAEVLQFIANQ